LDKESDSSLILVPEEIKEFLTRTIIASALDEYLATFDQFFQGRISILISIQKLVISIEFQFTTFSNIRFRRKKGGYQVPGRVDSYCRFKITVFYLIYTETIKFGS